MNTICKTKPKGVECKQLIRQICTQCFEWASKAQLDTREVFPTGLMTSNDCQSLNKELTVDASYRQRLLELITPATLGFTVVGLIIGLAVLARFCWMRQPNAKPDLDRGKRSEEKQKEKEQEQALDILERQKWEPLRLSQGNSRSSGLTSEELTSGDEMATSEHKATTNSKSTTTSLEASTTSSLTSERKTDTQETSESDSIDSTPSDGQGKATANPEVASSSSTQEGQQRGGPFDWLGLLRGKRSEPFDL